MNQFFKFLLIAIILSILSCKSNHSRNIKSIFETDKYYSKMSVEKGRNTAFLAMFDTSAVMLSSHSMPIIGYTAIKKRLLSHNDSSFSLSWDPKYAKVSQSGELGYSYGLYKLYDSHTKQLIEEGTYTTFWKKNSNGEWKATLDTGNEGIR